MADIQTTKESYDAFKQNPGFALWNIVKVDKTDNTWNIDLVGRDHEHIARVRINKANLQDEVANGTLSLTGAYKNPYSAKEDNGITIVDRYTCYMTHVQIDFGSQSNVDDTTMMYKSIPTNNTAIMAITNARNSRAAYMKWKALPQTPLENAVTSVEPREYYFGLPHIVYMHLVGQLCTVI